MNYIVLGSGRFGSVPTAPSGCAPSPSHSRRFALIPDSLGIGGGGSFRGGRDIALAPRPESGGLFSWRASGSGLQMRPHG